MSTARLSGLDLGETGATGDTSLGSSLKTVPMALGAALLSLCLYAAFAHGAVQPAPFERVQIAVSIVALIAAAAWLWNRTLALRAGPLAWGGLGLLASFAAWSGLTLLWSVAPDQTWAECNRAVTYVLVLVLAIGFGASHPRARELVAGGFLAVCLLVTVYALGQKLFPGINVPGLFHLNQTGELPRLQEPFGYWNALALFVAFGVPIALAAAADTTRGRRVRVGAVLAIVPMLVTLAFTYSRGGVLALACGLAVAMVVSRAGLRSLMWLALATAAAAPPVVLGLLSHSLTGMNVAMGRRELAGVELAALLVACMTLLSIAAHRVMERERTVVFSDDDARRVKRGLLGVLAALVVVGVLVFTFSSRGITGTVSHVWSDFTTTKAVSVYDPGRLLSADSENRWVWWKEAADAFADRPVAGWGAGSFGVVHLLYRHNTLSVQQPHSVPLQFLAETGVIGALLGLGGIALLLAAAVKATARLPKSPERLLAAALLGASVVYAVHSLYDWDWDIPGVTVPALLFLGILAGRPQRTTQPSCSGSLRGAAVAFSTLVLATSAASVIVPRLAAAKAQQALVSAATAPRAGLKPALSEALFASRLDPLSDAGLLAAATIELHLGDAVQSQRDLLAALRREPTDGEAWLRLAAQDLALGDAPDALRAARRARALDPYGTAPRALVRQIERVGA